MSITLCGDIHGELNIDKILEYYELAEASDSNDKSDYLIILGDAGILWDNGTQDQEVQTILNHLPATVLWVDGNHENFELLDNYPQERWHGGLVHRISDHIIHLMRGQVFEIEGYTFFTFGGGYSIDRANRQWGVDWWAEEMPSNYEYEEGFSNLEKVDFKVDYILSHTCPESVAKQLVHIVYPGEEPLQRYFERIAEMTEFNDWYFGHWHMDENIGRFHCLFHDMVELTE